MTAARTPRLRIACIQMRSGIDEGQNIEIMSSLVLEAAARGAQYIQTPEVTGIVQRDKARLMQAISPDADNPVFAQAAALAAKNGIYLHVGSTAVKAPDGRCFNRGALFGPSGGRIATYDKIHMFDVDLPNGESWRESASVAAGDKAIVADLPIGMFGMAICYDLRFAALFRQYARAGASVLTCPSCFTRQTGQAHWHTLMRARAIENGAFMIAAAQGGRHEDGRETFGHSLVVNPWGEIVAELEHDEPGLLMADIDLGEVDAARNKIPGLRNERQFELVAVKAPAPSSGRARENRGAA